MPTSLPAPEMSREEIDKLRAYLHQQDKRMQPNVFDLSKPPTEPYVYRKFPHTIYNEAKSSPARIIRREMIVNNRVVESETHVPAKIVSKTVNDEKELAKALKDGWSETPPAFEPGDETLATPIAPQPVA